MRNAIICFAAVIISGCVISSQPGLLIETSSRDRLANSGRNENQPLKAVKEVRIYNSNFIMQVSNNKKISANVTYLDDTVDSNLIFSSSDDTILQVDVNGKVTAIREGVATIVAQSILEPSKRAVVNVTVKPELSVPTVAFLNPSSAIFSIGESKRFEARVQMSNGEDSPNIIWKSDNEAIAVVTNGLVTGVSVGETSIHAEALGDPSKRATAKIKVVLKNE